MAAGRKTGGRTKGTPNKSNAERTAAIAASGETPLDYMLRIMRDTKADPERRDKCAAQAAPYVHAKLANVEMGGPDGKPIPFVHKLERLIVDPPNRDGADIPPAA